MALAASILGEGETSRLHRRLVRKDQIALSAGFGINALIAGNSLGLGSVRAVPGQDLDEVVDDVRRRRCGSFAADGPTDSELASRGPRPSATGSTRWARPPAAPTPSPACALLFDDPEAVNERLPLLRSITADEVREAAATWLLPA